FRVLSHAAMIVSLVLLLLTPSLVDASCIFCVSPTVAWIGRGLHSVNPSRTVEGNAMCVRNITRIKDPARCSGACFTLNLTKEGSTEPNGVMRDCLDSNPKVKLQLEERRDPETDSFDGVCFSETVRFKGMEYNATYCACEGHLCNNDGTPLAARGRDEGEHASLLPRRGSRPRFSPNSAECTLGVQSLSTLAFVALMAAARRM
ncbi:hypothetical protein PFISCL1PPCAC_3722, partial [Pristionchus fissidentatus]